MTRIWDSSLKIVRSHAITILICLLPRFGTTTGIILNGNLEDVTSHDGFYMNQVTFVYISVSHHASLEHGAFGSDLSVLSTGPPRPRITFRNKNLLVIFLTFTGQPVAHYFTGTFLKNFFTEQFLTKMNKKCL